MGSRLLIIVGMLLSSVPLVSDVDLGIVHYRTGEYDQAFAELKPPAEDGDTSAQYYLSLLYEEGKGVEADPDLARLWLERAAIGGEVRALYKRARCTLSEEPVDAETAISWLERAAGQDYARAAAYLGYLYSAGNVVPFDGDKAMEWARYGAERGSDWATRSIGVFYDKGIGVEVDPVEAARWLAEAADYGEIKAQRRLAEKYANGRGVPQDMDLARFWCAVSSNNSLGAVGFCLNLQAEMGDAEFEAYRQRSFRFKRIPHPFIEKRMEEIAREVMQALDIQIIHCPSSGTGQMCGLFLGSTEEFSSAWDREFRNARFPEIIEPRIGWYEPFLDKRVPYEIQRNFSVDDQPFSVRFEPARNLVQLSYPSRDDREWELLVRSVEPNPTTHAQPIAEFKVIPRNPTGTPRQIQARVRLLIRVEPDGSVGPIQLTEVEPLGYGFDEAAVEAVRQWRFKPATRDGDPVAVFYRLTFDF